MVSCHLMPVGLEKNCFTWKTSRMINAQGWPEIETRAQGWDLLPHPDSTGNKVIKYSSSITDTQMFYQDGTYEDAVWRISVLPQGKPETIRFYWHQNEDTGTYTVINYEWGVIIGRSDGSADINLGEVGRFLKENEWQTFEISTYDDTLEVWLDSILVFRYDDPLLSHWLKHPIT